MFDNNLNQSVEINQLIKECKYNLNLIRNDMNMINTCINKVIYSSDCNNIIGSDVGGDGLERRNELAVNYLPENQQALATPISRLRVKYFEYKTQQKIKKQIDMFIPDYTSTPKYNLPKTSTPKRLFIQQQQHQQHHFIVTHEKIKSSKQQKHTTCRLKQNNCKCKKVKSKSKYLHKIIKKKLNFTSIKISNFQHQHHQHHHHHHHHHYYENFYKLKEDQHEILHHQQHFHQHQPQQSFQYLPY